MLTNIIGTKDSTPTPSPPPPPTPVKSKKDKDKKKKSNDSSDDDSSPERLKNKALESLKKKKANDLKVAELRNDDDVNVMSVDDKYKCTQKINYVHYDPQMHWCKQCNIFPKTAKDFLIHLHSKEHQDTQKIIEPPWHDKQTNDEMPNYPDAPTKRTPIRGLQFFVPTTGWYCTICSIWMGDLHCASLHLKSQTHASNYNDYNNLNPHFEVDWMGERHKAYEESRQKKPLAIADRPSLQQPAQIVPIPMPVPPPSLTMEQEVIEGIPLQLQIPTTHKLDLDEGKKKKKKKKSDEKKEKKKKKRSKKRRQSSSSSSSSDSSDSEANTPAEKSREDTSHSIRVAMRNLLKQQSEKKLEDSGGKWTVVQPAQVAEPAPPPPTISTNGENDNRRDDLMISQWNNPEPIITEDEKKLFEQLKGRLKANSKEREVNGRKRSKERSKEPKERNESRERDRDRDRDRERNRRRRSRSRSQSRNKRSRSRDRRRSRSRERRRSRSRSRGRFRSRSRSTGRWGRRWSRSRSRSRGGRVEKPIVRYPEFRPRVPEKESEKLDRKKGEKKREQDEPKNGGSASRTDSKKTVIVLKNPNTNKKLPFIGRMPVFKRQANEEEVKKPETVTESVPNPNYHSTYYEGSTNVPPQMPMEDYDDLMPDPMQFVSLMGSAPPPPPMVPPPPSTVDKNEPVLPPGIDEADADLVRKTISDAPLPRKGPLPQDFQDALSIIFDQKPIPDPETDKINLPEPNCEAESQIIPMQIVDEQSQHTIDLYQASFPLTGLKPDADLSFAEDVDIPEPMPLAIPPPPPPPTHEEVSKSIEMVDEDPIVAAKKLEDSALMDDLAMLGIDASDLAAQCI